MNSDNINTPDNDNTFLSRGCCRKPNINNQDNDIFNNGCCKLDSFDWLKNINLPATAQNFECVEVRFKNSRKDFYRLPDGLELGTGDIVAVEASPGHDLGLVSLTGETARIQMKRKEIDPQSADIKKLYRRAKTYDIEKWLQSVDKEDRTMLNTRKIARDLKLKMKVNDVEYQGDNTKAIFYFTAEERVDFRELIKLLADEFKIRIEMRQIGVRQEAARLGGIGSCGRELCCATWMTNFRSVTTASARVQQLSLNPQKLAGQCAKLKCCLSYEYDNYVDTLSEFPDQNIILKTKKGDAAHQKTDVFGRILWYSYIDNPGKFVAVPVDKVKHIIVLNKKNKLPDNLEDFTTYRETKKNYESVIEYDDINRFDKKKRKKQ
ncbi:MAG: hypothetical protein GY834_14295 [Bacteroidetes bacterium]|nr:hypothetical protein [Bacteroidota bacterium]